MSDNESVQQRSRATRILMGCAIGCGGFLLLSMVGCVSCVVWLNSPGDVIDPESLLAEDTTGYLEWTVDLEDPGTRQLVESFLSSLEETQRQGIPDNGPGRFIGRLQQLANKNNRKDMEKLFPIVLAGTMRPAGGGTDGFVLTGSVRGMDHQLLLFDWIGTPILRRLMDSGSLDENTITWSIERYGGEKIFVIPTGDPDVTLGGFLRGGDIFVASSMDEARRAVDLLSGRLPPDAGTAAVDRWFGEAPQTSLRGALSNGDGELGRLWDALPWTASDEPLPENVLSEVRGVVFSGGFEGGVFSVHLDFDMAGAAAAESAEAALVAGLNAKLAETIFHLGEVGRSGDRLRVSLLTDSLVETLEDLPARIR